MTTLPAEKWAIIEEHFNKLSIVSPSSRPSWARRSVAIPARNLFSWRSTVIYRIPLFCNHKKKQHDITSSIVSFPTEAKSTVPRHQRWPVRQMLGRERPPECGQRRARGAAWDWRAARGRFYFLLWCETKNKRRIVRVFVISFRALSHRSEWTRGII